MEVFRKIFCLGEAISLGAKACRLGEDRKKIEENGEEEMRDEKERIEFLYSQVSRSGGRMVCMKGIWEEVLFKLPFLQIAGVPLSYLQLKSRGFTHMKNLNIEENKD